MSFEGTMALVTNQCFSLWRLYVTLGVEWAVKPHSLTYSLSMLIIMSFHFLAIRFSAKQQSLPEENIVPQDSVITIESDSGMFLRPQFKVNMFLLWLRKNCHCCAALHYHRDLQDITGIIVKDNCADLLILDANRSLILMHWFVMNEISRIILCAGWIISKLNRLSDPWDITTNITPTNI